MEQDNFEVTIAFTPALLEAHPALATWRATFRLDARLPVGFLMQDDIVSMQGIPLQEPLAVVGRAWTVMSDKVTLTLVLGQPGALEHR